LASVVSRRVASEEEEELTTTMAKSAEVSVTVTERYNFWSTITGKCFIGFVVIFEVSVITLRLIHHT